MKRFPVGIVTLALAAVFAVSNIATANYTPPSDLDSKGSGAPCHSQGVKEGVVFDGNLEYIDARKAYVGIEFCWDGSLVNWTVIDWFNVYENIYPPLQGRYFIYPAGNHTLAQAEEKFYRYAAGRMGTLGSRSSDEITAWQETLLFYPVPTEVPVSRSSNAAQVNSSSEGLQNPLPIETRESVNTNQPKVVYIEVEKEAAVVTVPETTQVPETVVAEPQVTVPNSQTTTEPVPVAPPTSGTLSCNGCVEVTVSGGSSSTSSQTETDDHTSGPIPSDASSSAEEKSDKDENEWTNKECKAYLSKHSFSMDPKQKKLWKSKKKVPKGNLFWVSDPWSNASDPNWPRKGHKKVWFGKKRPSLIFGGSYYSVPAECKSYASKQFEGVSHTEITVKQLMKAQNKLRSQ